MTIECVIPHDILMKLKTLMINSNEEKDYYCYENDIQPLYEYFCNRHVWFNSINEDRQATIIYMAFMGIKNFESFVKMIEALKNFDYHSASREILNSNFAKKFHNKSKLISEYLVKGCI